MYKVPMEDAKMRLPELVRAALRGETVLIAQDDEQAVQLVPVRRAIGRKTGSAKGAVVAGEPRSAIALCLNSRALLQAPPSPPASTVASPPASDGLF